MREAAVIGVWEAAYSTLESVGQLLGTPPLSEDLPRWKNLFGLGRGPLMYQLTERLEPVKRHSRMPRNEPHYVVMTSKRRSITQVGDQASVAGLDVRLLKDLLPGPWPFRLGEMALSTLLITRRLTTYCLPATV